jgi:hypothetical protein
MVEFFGAFPGQKNEHAASIGEAMAEVIFRGCGLTLARLRTAGELCISLIGCDLRFCSHRWKYPFAREFRARGVRPAVENRGKLLAGGEI